MSTDAEGHWGKWIKHRAKFVGVKLQDVASAVGVAPHTLSRWLRSDEMPSLRKEQRAILAQTLEIPPAYISVAHVFGKPDSFTVRNVDDSQIDHEDVERSLRREALGSIVDYCVTHLSTHELIQVREHVYERVLLAQHRRLASNAEARLRDKNSQD